MNRMQKLRRKRSLARTRSPQGWGQDQLTQRAEKAAQIMRKFDLMPPVYRALANEYGMKVRTMMAEGAKPEQIRKEFASSTSR